jgi:hypothetical protein
LPELGHEFSGYPAPGFPGASTRSCQAPRATFPDAPRWIRLAELRVDPNGRALTPLGERTKGELRVTWALVGLMLEQAWRLLDIDARLR